MSSTPAWDPAGVLAQLLKIDPGKAKILLTGMAVIASAALVMAWQIDMPTARWVVGYILAFAAALYLFDLVFNDPSLKKVLGWFVVVLIISWTTAVFASSAAPKVAARAGLAPSYCLIQFWRDCDDLAGEIARRNPPVPVAVQPFQLPEKKVQPGQYSVAIRFAGVIDRDDVIAVAQLLAQEGWKVAQADRGGQRTADAYGLNEVRYGAKDDEDAADAVARRFQGARIVSDSIRVTHDPGVAPKALEVWISR